MILALALSQAEAETVRRVKDINTTAASTFFSPRVAIGSTIYFQSCTTILPSGSSSGCGLYRLAATGNASLVKAFGTIASMINANGTLYLLANDGSSTGLGLWKSDGTPAGTVEVKPFTTTSSLKLYYLNGTVFLSPSYGQLWKSDGTTPGTVLLKGISGELQDATVANGVLFFKVGFTFQHGDFHQLWKTDGTPDGTVMVATLATTGPSQVSVFTSGTPLTAMGANMFFTGWDSGAGYELWRSDGTEAGTGRIKDIVPGASDSRPLEITNVNGTLFFSASDPINGRELWKSDGTEAGTVLVKDIAPGSVGSSPSLLTPMNGALFFSACDGTTCGLWRSDGTPGGTSRMGAAGEQGTVAQPSAVVESNGTLFLSADDGATGRELWKSDGTAAGTVQVKDLRSGSPGSAPTLLTAASGFVGFAACDAGSCGLWRSDGTATGTTPVGGVPFTSAGSVPSDLTDVNGTLFFVANDGISGREVWRSDGTAEGTAMVKDLAPGSAGLGASRLTDVNGVLYFVSPTTTVGSQGVLWRSDGTNSGTPLVKTVGSAPYSLTNVGGILFLDTYDNTGNPANHGLWRSDGTPAGTIRLTADRAAPMASFAGALFFTGGGLWRSDGTVAGTRQVAATPSFISKMASAGGVLYFNSGGGLWRSDGSASGTSKVKDVGTLQNLTDVSGRLFFSGYSDGELWTSDGTSAGTTLLDLRPDTSAAQPTGLIARKGVLYFTANDGVHGREMWRSDGTLAGTVMVKDINPGSGSGIDANPFSGDAEIKVFTELNGSLYFSADDGIHGQQLWKSDGTAAGTVMVADIVTTDRVASGGRLFFVGPDKELWALERSTTQTALSSTANPARLGDPVSFNATVSVTPDACATPSGTVVFNDGARMLGAATLSGGQASLSTSTLNAGTHTMTATYAGDRDCAGSASSPLSQTVTAFPALSINDVSQAEGNTGSSTMTFEVTLSPASSQTITVAFATRDVTATSTSDYSGSSGTLTFLAGETRKAVAVSILGDTKAENNESFNVDLSGPLNAVIVRGRGTGVIRDDDGTATSRPQSSWNDFFAVDTRETPYIGDFNGDGRTDLITFTRDNPAAFGDVYVSLSEGDGFGPNTKWNDWFAINSDERVVIGDFDGDGKEDIATWLQKTSGQVYVARSLGTGMEEATLWLGRIGRDSNDLIKAADVNGDGKADLVDFARTEGKVYVAISTGTQFQMPALWHGFFAVSAYERPEVADLNGDGKADIVTFATNSPTAFGDVYVSLSTGTRFGENDSSSKWHDFFAIRPEEEVRIGDLNGDGRDDFFTFLPPPFAQCYTALSQGTAMGESVLWPEAIAPDAKDGKFVGDVNGDGKADIIIFAQGEGRVYVSLGK